MKITIQVTAVASLIFALVCFGVAIHGFNALREITDPAIAADTRGFAWFWAFLGAIGVVFAGVAWWLIRSAKEQTQ